MLGLGKLSFQLLGEIFFYSEVWISWVNKLYFAEGRKEKYLVAHSVLANGTRFADFPISLLLWHPKPPRPALGEGDSSP